MDLNSIVTSLIVGGLVLLSFLTLGNVIGVNRKANIYFGIFLFLWSTFWTDEMVFSKGGHEATELWYVRLAQYLVPLTFYFSVKFYTNPTFKYSPKDLKFLVVPLLFLILLAMEDFLQRRTFEISYIVFVLGHGLFYSILAYVKIQKHQRDIEFFSSDTDSIDLRWIKYIIFSFIASALLIIVYSIFSNAEALNIYLNLFFLVVVYLVAFHSIRQKEIYPKGLTIEDTLAGEDFGEATAKGERIKLMEENELSNTRNTLLELMEKEKPYLDSELNLLKLADKMGISSHQLSYVLNEGIGENFFYFTNKYRVQKAEALLMDPANDHLNMLAIGYEAGFNSKTSFNTTFKKMTSYTPSEYKRNRSKL